MNINAYIFSKSPDIREVPYGEYVLTPGEELLMAELMGNGWNIRRMIADALPYWELSKNGATICEVVLKAAARQALGSK